MTVGVAYRVPGVGAVLVSDGRITHDGELVSDNARKYVLCGATAVIVSGEIGQAWRRLQEKPPRSFAALRTAIVESKEDNDWLAYNRSNDQLWLGEVRISGPFATLGSGASLALGALEVLPLARTLVDAEQVAQRAVRAACARHVECGGKIRTVIVPRKGDVTIR